MKYSDACIAYVKIEKHIRFDFCLLELALCLCQSYRVMVINGSLENDTAGEKTPDPKEDHSVLSFLDQKRCPTCWVTFS